MADAEADAEQAPNREEELPGDEDLQEAAAMVEPPAPGDTQARAANLWADPKMVALKTHMLAHKREDRRIAALGTSASAPDLNRRSTSLRMQGCDTVDKLMKKLGAEQLVLPRNRPLRDSSKRLPVRSASASRLSVVSAVEDGPVDPEVLQDKVRKCSKLHIKHHWKESVDATMKQLLIDLELGRHESLKGKEDHSSECCCDHLDKMYDWHSNIGVQQSQPGPQKRSAGPSHIRYNPSAPVRPGSLRVAPQNRRAPTRSGNEAPVAPSPLAHAGSRALEPPTE